MGCHVEFLWIPEHSQIEGNKMSDKLESLSKQTKILKMCCEEKEKRKEKVGASVTKKNKQKSKVADIIPFYNHL